MAKGKRGKKRKVSPSSARKIQISPEQDQPEEAAELKKSVIQDKPAKTTAFFRRLDWIAGFLTALISFGVYLYTLAPDVTLEDSGELAVGSMYAGVPHPPGYPMWTIYSWVFTKILPFSNIAWRVAVSSAFAAALSCGIIAMMVSRGSMLMLEGMAQFRDLAERHRQSICLIAGISSGLVLGFNGFMWSQAVIVEVYTLGILTFAMTLIFMMRWFFMPDKRIYLYLAYFSFGLCFTNHQTLIIAAVGLEILVALADKKLGRDFLVCNCVLYIAGLALSLKTVDDPTSGNHGLFILYNLVGTGLMATLLALTIRMPRTSICVLVGIAYFLIAIIYGIGWEALIDKSQVEGITGLQKAAALSKATVMVKVWALLNILLLAALIAYSWIHHWINPPNKERGLLANWMPMLNTRACWIAGAALYLYMPIASMTNPPMNWAYPRTTKGFWHAFTRGQYDQIDSSSFTRMFINHQHKDDKEKISGFNGGQVRIYLDEAREEFSLSFMAITLIPMAFIPWMRHKDIRWIAGLTGIYISFTLVLIYLINPSASEQNRHLNKVFFAATHLFIAIGLGCGLALLGATIASRFSQLRISLTGLLLLLIGWECYASFKIFNETEFLIPRMATVIGLVLISGLLLLVTASLVAKFEHANKIFIIFPLFIFALLPLRPALNNWSDNEQRDHLFGFWYGHDMFTPPFDVYPEMDQNAILFGGTDPGRFCPTYMIFCESFIAPKNKRDPEFDRRDAYIITQNALADGTYLQYIRAHYNRSAQIDPEFFSEIMKKWNNHSKRILISFFLALGITLGLGIIAFVAIRISMGVKPDITLIGKGIWSMAIISICFIGLSKSVNSSFAEKADSFFIELGESVEKSRRISGVYPKNEINTPSIEDNQIAFHTYYEDARKRMLKRQLLHGEKVTLVVQFQCTNCASSFPAAFNKQSIGALEKITQDGGIPCQTCATRGLTGNKMRGSEPRVQVQGNAAVMAINALLAKNIFNTNRQHEFYLEESFPLSWMYPYMTPYGIIFKLEAEKEFEIASITPPNTSLVGFKPGDTLTPTNTETDTRLSTILPGKFTVGTVSDDGIIKSIHVTNPGKYLIQPANSTYVFSGATNATPARIKVQMEPIPGTPSHRISKARIDADFPGVGYTKGQNLLIQSPFGYKPIQYQGTDQYQKTNPVSFLSVSKVNELGSIMEISIKNDGGRFIAMPPTEYLFTNDSGMTFRAVIDFRRIPKHKERLPEQILENDRKFWSQYSERLIGNWINQETTVEDVCKWARRIYLRRDLTDFKGDPIFVRDNDAQKAFSKLRSAVAALYAWRYGITADHALKEQYAREADFAFRQAFAFGPINPEVSFKYVNFLSARGRFEDAKLIAQTLNDTDPNSDAARVLLPQILLNQERQLVAKREFAKAAEVAFEMAQLDDNNPDHLVRHQYYLRIMQQNRSFISAFNNSPNNVTNFIRAIQLYRGMHKTNEITRAIELFSKKSDVNSMSLTAIKNAYGLIGDWEGKLKADLQLTEHEPDSYAAWFDLSETHIRMKQTNESTQAMLKALNLFEDSEIRAPDIIPILRTNTLLKPLRDQPEIKKILQNN
jgi:tetratricopeptide (TPR) repeat protein